MLVNIANFANKETEDIFYGRRSKIVPSELNQLALRKLNILNASGNLQDLMVPPSNRLKKLSGNRKNQYSIRINDKYRICFCVKNNQFHDVEIVDYH